VKALDTCVLARYFVADHPEQTRLAERQIAEGGFVPVTVLLELAWLLRSRYRYTRQLVAASIEELDKLPNLVLANENAIAWVVARIRAGADVADLIHLTAAEGCAAFVTFDDMSKEVGPDTPVAIELLS
jgi:predicted nucleic-acid-binding protein